MGLTRRAVGVAIVAAFVLAAAPPGLAGKGGGGKPGGSDPPAATDPDIVCVGDTAYDALNSGYLHVMNADGSGLKKIHDGWVDGRPAWSPDGTRILFGGSDLQGTGGVLSIARDGSDLRVVVALPRIPFKVAWAAQPLVAGGQRKIAFEGTVDHDGDGYHSVDEIDIFIANEDGTDVVNVTNTPDVAERHPDWSADGRRLAFARPVASGAGEQDVIVVDFSFVDGALVATEKNLTAGAEGDRLFGVHVTHPAWARTQDLLAVVAKDAAGNFTQLWVLDPNDLTYGEELTADHDDGQILRQPCWSWDDSLIVYMGSNDQYATGSLWTITSDGTSKTELYRRAGKFRANSYPLGLSMPIWRLQPPSTP